MRVCDSKCVGGIVEVMAANSLLGLEAQAGKYSKSSFLLEKEAWSEQMRN